MSSQISIPSALNHRRCAVVMSRASTQTITCVSEERATDARAHAATYAAGANMFLSVHRQMAFVTISTSLSAADYRTDSRDALLHVNGILEVTLPEKMMLEAIDGGQIPIRALLLGRLDEFTDVGPSTHPEGVGESSAILANHHVRRVKERDLLREIQTFERH